MATIGGLSAHAGQDVLLTYAKAAEGKLKKLFLVHSEPQVEEVFCQKLNEAKINPVVYPAPFETLEL